MVGDRVQRGGAGFGDLPLKGLAKATRASVFIERTHRSLTREAEEAFFSEAEILTEGSRAGDDATASFFGSTMLTVDLDRLSTKLRDLESPAMRELFRELVGSSARVRLRAMRIACAEVARRVPELYTGTAQVEIRVSLVGRLLHLDVDLEVPVELPSEHTAP